MQAHPLLLELSAAQQHLLQLIWEPMRDENRWPIWDHVENGMYDAGFTNAELALRSMPTVGALTAADPHYSLVWYDHWNLNPKSVGFATWAAAVATKTATNRSGVYVSPYTNNNRGPYPTSLIRLRTIWIPRPPTLRSSNGASTFTGPAEHGSNGCPSSSIS